MNEITTDIVPKNGKILIVDDEEIVHQTLKRLLASDGYSIDSAYGGKEALNKLDAGYDLLICDIRMSDMDGIEVLQEVKKREIEVEVLMITGYASLESATRAMNYGARGYLLKPIENILEFKNQVREAIYIAKIASKNKNSYKSIISDLIVDNLRHASQEEMKEIAQSLFQVIHDAVVILDSDGSITFANIYFAKMIGEPYPDVLGARFESFIPQAEQDKIIEALTRLSTGQADVNIRTSLKTSFERLLSVIINCVPIYHNEEYSGAVMVISDVTEISKVKEKMDLLAYMVENARYDMMFIVQPEGQIMECNALTRDTFGYSQDEMLSQNIGLLLKSETDGGWDKIIDRVKHGSSWRGEIIAISRDGREFPVEMTVSRSLSKFNNTMNIICFMRDITVRKKADELRLENVRLSHASKAKSEFLSIMNHEMRTPLNSIIGFSSLLKLKKSGKLNEEQEKFVDNILKSSNQLLNMINNLINLTKIEADKLELVFEKISIPVMVNEVLDHLKENTAQNNIILKKEIDLELDIIEADRSGLKQIFFNLVTNAIKFSKPGGGVITVTAKKEGEMVEFSVSDTGIGIKEEDMGRLFNLFQQVDSGISRKYGGTGLGLTITKKLVELHKGSITVKSRPDDGSTFTFLLPLKHGQI